MGKLVYVLTWPLSAILMRLFQGPKKERKARAELVRLQLKAAKVRDR